MSTGGFSELRVEGVSRSYGRRRALKAATFTVNAGEVAALVGPNGAGKSTLLAILSTLSRPTSGRVAYGRLEAPRDALAIRMGLGFLGHDLGLYPDLTARENLQFFAELYDAGADTGTIDAALVAARLADRADDPVAGFSRGMRQRLGLERALLHGPSLVLLDEPFTGLDDESCALLLERLRTLRRVGTMVVLATHDLDLVDGNVDRALVMVEGHLDEIEVGGGLREQYRAHLALRSSSAAGSPSHARG